MNFSISLNRMCKVLFFPCVANPPALFHAQHNFGLGK
jgi:hypothetical protein